jgi:hypothetical protein
MGWSGIWAPSGDATASVQNCIQTNSSVGLTPAMEDFFKEFNEIDWRTYRTFSALSSFERFTRDTEKLVANDAARLEQQEGPTWTAETEAEIAERFGEIRAIRCVHDEVITPTFRYAAVITLFALMERELRRVGDTLAAETKVPLSFRNISGGHYAHVRKYVLEHAGVDFAVLPGCSQIHDLQKVRDCLVHCYGDAGLSRDREYLVKLSGLHIGIEVDPGCEMMISPAFFERSIEAIRQFFHALFGRLNWKINQRWLAAPNPS